MWLLLAMLAVAQAGEVSITRMGRGFINPWIVREGEQVLLIDTHYAQSARWLERRLAREGVDPAKITAIVITHAHADHAGAVTALREITKAPVILGSGDVPMAAAGFNGEIHPTGIVGAFVKPTVKRRYPGFTPDVVVQDREDLAPYGFVGTVEVVGGHTDGSLVVRLPDGVVFTGDLVRGRFTAPHRPVVHFFQPDETVSEASLGAALEGAVTVYPGHGDAMEAARVQRWLERR